MDCPKKLLKFSSSWESCFLFLRITGPTPCVEAIIACADGYAQLLTDIESYLFIMPLTSLLTLNFKINMYKIFITWRSFRIDCDPVSETWWWSAEEDPEVFQLFLMHKRILCQSSLFCIFTNFLTKGWPPPPDPQFFWTLFKKPLTPPPRFEHYVAIFFDGFLKKRVNVCRDKIPQNNA